MVEAWKRICRTIDRSGAIAVAFFAGASVYLSIFQ
jgi:hypothetical protein